MRVAIRSDVAQRLDQAKRPGETYSDVIERILDDRSPLMAALEYARTHPIKGRDTLTPRLRKIRADGNRGAEERWKRLEAYMARTGP